MKQLGGLFLAILFAGCSQYSIKGADGSTVSGSLLNGSASYSSGAACAPAVPSPTTPIPASPATPAMAVQRKLCDANGANCQTVLEPVRDASAPQCMTQLAVVRGTDISTFFGWLFAALGASAVAVASGT